MNDEINLAMQAVIQTAPNNWVVALNDLVNDRLCGLDDRQIRIDRVSRTVIGYMQQNDGQLPPISLLYQVALNGRTS